TTTLARRMIERTKIATALRGVRGRDAVDLDALEQLLVRFSELVVEQPQIADIEINPLLVSADQMLALDARVILQPAGIPAAELPRPAIRPYPLQYSTSWTARDGTGYAIRPIRPEDETLLVEFHGTLSEQSIYQRYFENLGLDLRLAHERLIRVCFSDYDRELALVAECTDAHGTPIIAGVGRLSKLRDGVSGEFAVLVSDRYQGRGLGSELLARLVDIARREGLSLIMADILATNGPMIRLAQGQGFAIEGDLADEVVHARLELSPVDPMSATDGATSS
ncbi:MAG: GNAT family N-acetyltransferase, partial [Chloroflexi bacterium]|nr:GNAT family N-acetyltransferase [Chloroflexota bacterium]